MGDSVEMAAVDVARLYCGLNRYFRYRCFILRGDCLHTYIDTKLVKVWRIRKFLQRIAAYQTVKGKEATRFLKMFIWDGSGLQQRDKWHPTATSVVSKSPFTAEDYTDTTLYGKLFRPAIFLKPTFLRCCTD